MTDIGGIILCGGKSSRMGQPKAWLPFGNETMLERVARILADCVSPLVVVAAPDQELPPLASGVLVARDHREGRGPLEGLLAGLDAIAPLSRAAYVTSCDVPLLERRFVQRMIEHFVDCDVAVPIEGDLHHPLAAVYSSELTPQIKSLLDQDRLRPVYLFDLVRTKRISVDELRAVDPYLDSLTNLNRWEEYQQAIRRLGT